MSNKIYFIIDADTYEIISKPFLKLEDAQRNLKRYEKARDLRKLHGIISKNCTIRNYEILDCETEIFDESCLEKLKQEQKYCDELNAKFKDIVIKLFGNAHS